MRTTAEVRRELERARLWTNNTELLAMLVEVMSVLASERRMSKPIEVPRPKWLRKGKRGSAADARFGESAGGSADGNAYRRAAQVMMANASPGRVNGRARVGA